MKAYKGFNKDLTCSGFQYKEGETYHADKAELCKEGFHACENPLDCFDYYEPGKSVYHEVEVDELAEGKDADSKVCGKTIKIGAALDVAGICKAHFEYVNSRTTNYDDGRDNSSLSARSWSSLSAQDGSSLSAQNWSSLSARNGSSLSAQDGSSLSAQDGSSLSAQNWSSLSAQDDSSLAAGQNSVLAAFNSKAKAGIGSIIAIANRKFYGGKWVVTDWAACVVDGEKIKADTWYKVENGQFVEVSE